MERVVATGLRSTAVQEQVRFVARELAGRRGVARYRLRGSGLKAYLRHGTPDVATLDDVFYSRHYDPPQPVDELLRGLGRAPEVLDLGANVGLFGLFALERFPDSRVLSFEPDGANAALLRQCAAVNDGRWEVVEAAAWTEDGSVPFVSGEYSISRIDPGAPRTVRAVDVLPLLERADWAKIDIEGAEWAILADPRFAGCSPRALVLEYHQHLCPDSSPLALAEQTLHASGYSVEPGQSFGPGHGIVWAWRP